MGIGDTRSLLYCLLPSHAVRRRERGVHTESDVVIDGVVEEDRFLADDTHQGTQIVCTIITDVGAIDGDGSLIGVVETRHEIGHGRLTATRLSDQRHGLAFGHLQTDIRQHFAIRLIREMHMVESDGIIEDDRFGVLRIHYIRLRREDRIYTLQGSDTSADAVRGFTEVFGRVDDGIEDDEVIDKRRRIDGSMIAEDE